MFWRMMSIPIIGFSLFVRVSFSKTPRGFIDSKLSAHVTLASNSIKVKEMAMMPLQDLSRPLDLESVIKIINSVDAKHLIESE